MTHGQAMAVVDARALLRTDCLCLEGFQVALQEGRVRVSWAGGQPLFDALETVTIGALHGMATAFGVGTPRPPENERRLAIER